MTIAIVIVILLTALIGIKDNILEKLKVDEKYIDLMRLLITLIGAIGIWYCITYLS